MIPSLKRILALVGKELKMMLLDPTAFLVGIVIPLIFVLIFGFAMSMDIKNINLTIVAPELEDTLALDLIARFRDNGYFNVTVTDSPKVAAEHLASRKADVTLSISPKLNRSAQFSEGDFLICVNGTQAPLAQSYRGTVQGVVDSVVTAATNSSSLNVRYRMWFNASNESRWFIIPGVIVIVMSVIGCLLTSMQVAGEYENGTMESILSTPVTPLEVLGSKMAANYLVGMVGLALSVGIGCLGMGVPFRGSVVWLFVGSTLFLCAQMALGLVISAATKNQFLAAMLAANLSFMPSTMLSGFMYEIANMSVPLQWISYLLPARYYYEFLQTAFLSGDNLVVYARSLAPLAGFMVFFLAWAMRSMSKVQKEASR